jgi:DNA-binding NarL/FixJ family response regulator
LTETIHDLGFWEVAMSRPSGLLRQEDLSLLALIAQGLQVGTIARELDTSERTVRRRTRQICDCLGVRTPVEAVVWAVRRGLV